MHKCKRNGEGERQKEIQRDRDREIERDRQKQTDTDRETERQRDVCPRGKWGRGRRETEDIGGTKCALVKAVVYSYNTYCIKLNHEQICNYKKHPTVL